MSKKKTLIQKFRRGIATLLASVMSISTLSSAGAITSYAATELIPVAMDMNDGGTTTAYLWKSVNVVDFAGISDSNLVGSDNPYTGGAGNIQATYGRDGYKHFIGTSNASKDKMNLIEMAAANNYNGGVYPSPSSGTYAYGLEVQVKTYPSANEKFVIVEYQVYNTTSNPVSGVNIGAVADVQIGNDDFATLYRNNNTIIMTNRSTLQTFEFIMNNGTIGVDNSNTNIRTWMGNYSGMDNHVFDHSALNYFDASVDSATSRPGDSALAYSWPLNLQPYEVQTFTVAFAIKSTTYYVSSSAGTDSSGTTGNYDDPFETIQYAVNRLGSTLGYVYIQDYAPDINAPITPGTTNASITFGSADYDSNGNSIDLSNPANIITLKRGAGLTSNPMFRTTAGSTLNFGDLILDGNLNASNEAPLIEANSGTIGIQSGAKLQNNIIATSGTIGSALNITGSANLDMNFGKVTGNKSAGKGAVHFDSSGYFRMRNEIEISNNVDTSSAQANVYLTTGRSITVNGELSGSVGVTTQTQPAAEDPSAAVQVPATRVTVVDSTNSGSIADPTYYTGVFTPDANASTGIFISTNGTDVVLKRTGLSVTKIYIDEQGNEVGSEVNLYYGVGETISLAGDTITNYEYVSAVLSQGSYHTLVLDAATGAVTGTMPNTPVVITYTYKRNSSSIKFHANYGTPTPTDLSGSVGSSVGASIPVVGKYGYDFSGWYSTNNFQTGTDVIALPSTFQAADLELYAKWTVNTGVLFDYLVRYTSADESLAFHTSPVAQYWAAHPITAQDVLVPGYVLNSYYVSPATYEGAPVGTFDTSDDFSGSMPNQDTQVTYSYRVDYGGAGFNYTIRHETTNGTPLRTDSVSTKYAEDPITASPEIFYGYDFASAQITLGDTAAPANYILGVADSPATDGSFSSQMPNQDVTIVYQYQSNGEGYDFVVEYLYSGEEIRDTVRAQHPTDDSISAVWENIYGYLYQSESVIPGGHGSFDASHNYTAQMPNDDVRVTYGYNRDPSKWRTITYLAGANGALNNTNRHAELTAGGGGYQAPLLITDGTAAGDANCYTWEKLGEKKLTPNAVPVYAYKLGGWYEDTNGNGVKDAGENYVTDSDIFAGNITLTADFVEDPDYWIDIYFASGARGSLTSGPTTMHVKLGTIWGDIMGSLPSCTAQVNYLADGWYVDGAPVSTGTVLVGGKTYIIQFKQDPNIFGTGLQAPDAIGNVDVDGTGMVTVFGTAGGYQYVITDLAGNIVAVQDGSDLSSSLIFHDLYPGSRYEVYEVNGGVTVQAGSTISSIASGDRSGAAEVLIPVVENNVSVLYDEEEEGKVKIVVAPADPDAKYAVIDKNGNVVYPDGSDADGWVIPSGSGPTAEWGGLDANEEYTIVAIPKGQTGVDPVTKLPDGTVILTDPSGELDIPYYIIETINGTILTCADEGVGSSYYNEAVTGDAVTIYADATDGSGNAFLYWKVLVGGGFRGNVTDQEFAFTMPGTNVVLCAYYERLAATPSNAAVEEEVRGGSENEMALDPSEVENLENLLTTAEDSDLIDINGADVTYKVVFHKNKARRSDLTLVKAESSVDDDHPDAFTGAWGLDIFIERYVNGRKAGAASPSNASPSNATFDVIIQLDKDDVDMMDYELYQLADDGSPTMVVYQVAISDDPEVTGGLFRFTAEANSRYILIYSKAYKVTVLNEVMPPAYYYRFKVRKGEAISDITYYQTHYDELTDRDAEWKRDYDWIDAEGNYHTWTDNDGVWHDYLGFSTRALPLKFKEYDFDRAIKNPRTIYAYYKNNRQQVLDERTELEKAIQNTIDLSNEYFLTIREQEELKELIRQAQEVLNQTDRRANYDELRDALKNLLQQRTPYKDVLDGRHNKYKDMRNSGGGGSGGGNGSGSGTKSIPYIPVRSDTYTVGVNGAWEQMKNNKWAFVLNGGTRLRGMWAWLVYTDNGVDKTGWYHFNREGIMNDGWFRDETLNWFYCDTVHDGGFGRMKAGWHYDTIDGYWYYLDPQSGRMVTGWKEIGGVWYYFTASNSVQTYTYDASVERWHYTNSSERPLGSMYVSEMTPDGCQVNDQGGWIR